MFTDKVNFILLIYSIYILIFVNGQGHITFKNNGRNSVNQTCIIKNSNLQGICIPFSKCKNAQITLTQHQINPTHCYYNGREPVVCCSDIFEEDDDHSYCRKSKIQCYKKPDVGDNSVLKCWEKECKKIVNDFEFGFDNCKPQYALYGIPTRIGDYPFMAAIGFRQTDGNTLFNCGGFLVTKNFVITAAHCTNFGGDSPVVVRTGGIDLDNNTATNLDIPIKNIYIHPLYKSNEAYNDIALIELTTASSDAWKCLSYNWYFQSYTGAKVIAVGYGQISFAGPSSNRLLEIDLVVVDKEECQKNYPLNDFLPKGILSSQVCAIDLKKENTQDTCQGDSGGPLLTFDLGKPELFGVTSFGNFCGSKTPGVYTRVPYYLDWLESIIWPNV